MHAKHIVPRQLFSFAFYSHRNTVLSARKNQDVLVFMDLRRYIHFTPREKRNILKWTLSFLIADLFLFLLFYHSLLTHVWIQSEAFNFSSLLFLPWSIPFAIQRGPSSVHSITVAIAIGDFFGVVCHALLGTAIGYKLRARRISWFLSVPISCAILVLMPVLSIKIMGGISENAHQPSHPYSQINPEVPSSSGLSID